MRTAILLFAFAAGLPPTRAAEDEFKPLFDGKSLDGWTFIVKADKDGKKADPRATWSVTDGTIRCTGKPNGCMVTAKEYGDYVLKVKWRFPADSKGGNSGVKYLVSEELPKTGYSAISFEYQVLDDENHPDAKMGIAGNRTAAALYDLLAPGSNKKLRPVGEFNESRIVKRGKRIEHWLNGARVLEFEQGSPALEERIAASKFKDTAGFGKYSRGHILIQDHDDQVWYRNLKIRELK